MFPRRMLAATCLATLGLFSACQRLKDCGPEYGECPASYSCVDYSLGTPGRCVLTEPSDIDAGATEKPSKVCSPVEAIFGTDNQSFFGNAVATNGRSVLIGAAGTDATVGRAFIYDEAAGTFSANASFTQQVTTQRATVGGSFGRSVSLVGSQAVVAGINGWYSFEDPGAGWVSRRVATVGAGQAKAVTTDGTYVALGVLANRTTVELRRLADGALCKFVNPSSGPVLTGFGEALAMAGGTLFIGAYGGSGTGSVQTTALTCPGNDETAQQILTKGSGIQFGTSVAASGTTLVVGAPGQSGSAPAFFSYGQNGSTWSAEAPVPSLDHGTGGGAEIGVSVAISGDLAVVGTPGADNGNGEVRIYQRVGAQWVELKTVTSAFPVMGATDQLIDLGRSVAVSGSLVVIGAPASKTNMMPTGAAVIYRCQ